MIMVNIIILILIFRATLRVWIECFFGFVLSACVNLVVKIVQFFYFFLFFCVLKIKYSLSTFDDVKNERRAHAFSGLHNMATVQVSEAEKVYILHGVRVSFIGCANLNTSQCKCIVIQ